MRKILLNIAFVFFVVVGYAQNLVPNPSFEIYSQCPTNQNQVDFATGWVNYGSSPDYFNSCTSVSSYSVPNNWGGYQMAHSGSAYSAIGSSGTYSPNLREFIGIQLISPLVIGTKYFVSIQAALSVSDKIYCNCATNNIGVKFSTVAYDANNPPLLNNYAHVYSSTIITDTTNWTLISGSFVADSSYQILMIGNFFDDAHTDTLRMNDSAYCNTYYYIDDICVSTDSLLCNSTTNLLESNKELIINVFPNPVVNTFYIKIPEAILVQKPKLKIVNSFGQICLKEDGLNSINMIEFQNFSEGIYYIIIQGENTIYKKTILKK